MHKSVNIGRPLPPHLQPISHVESPTTIGSSKGQYCGQYSEVGQCAQTIRLKAQCADTIKVREDIGIQPVSLVPG